MSSKAIGCSMSALVACGKSTEVKWCSKKAHHVCKVIEQLGRFLAISAAKLKKLRRPLNERCGSLTAEELRVTEHIVQEADVGFHSPDVKLEKGSLHLLDSCQEAAALNNDLQADN